MKTMKILLYSLLSLIALIIICLVLLLSTSWGLRLGLHVGKSYLPGQLEYNKVSGALISTIDIHQLSYHDGKINVTVGELKADISLPALLRKHVSIKTLFIDRIHYTSSANQSKTVSSTQTSPGGTKPSTEKSPFTIDIAQAKINHIMIEKHQINKLSFKGTSLLSAPFTMHWQGQINSQLAKNAAISAAFTLHGDQQKLDINANTDQLVISQWQATLQQWLSNDLSFTLKGDWKKFVLPISSSSTLTNHGGKLTANGQLDNYQLELTSELSGTQLPESQWSIKAQGNTQQLNFNTVTIKTLGGTLSAPGSLTWQPDLQWQFSLSGRQLNLKQYRQNWPQSQLNFAGTTSGTYQNAQLQTVSQIKQISGTINKQKTSGQLKLSMRQDHIQLDHADVYIGNNHLNAQASFARLSKQLNARWQIKAPDLQTIDPNFAGTVNSSGTIDGNLYHPEISAQAMINDLRLPGLIIKTMNASSSLDWQQNGKLDVNVIGKHIQFKRHTIQQVTITSQGTVAQQTWQVLLRSQWIDMDAAATGGIKNKRWQGQLSQLNLDKQSLKLQSPSNISIGKNAANIAPFCLNSSKHQAQLCGQLQFEKNQTMAGKLTIKNINLSMLNAWLPPAVILDAPVNGNITIEQQHTGQAVFGTANIDMTHLNLYRAKDKLTMLNLKNITLKAKLDQQGLLATIATADKKILAGKLFLKQFNLFNPTNPQQILDGQLNLHLPDLRFVALLSDSLDNSQGTIDSNFALNGTIAKPEFKGSATLSNGQVKIIPLNIIAKNIQLQADFNGQHNVNIKGSLNSGDGSLNLSGYTHYLPPFDSKITIKTNKLLTANTSEYKVLTTSDLLLEYNQTLLKLSGQLTIPEATIRPRDFSNVETLPDHVTYANDTQAQEKTLALAFDLDVILKNVKLYYQGLNATLQGNIKLKKSPKTLTTANGEFKTTQGSYKAYGQNLDITKGNFYFTGGPVDNPGIDIEAVRYIQTTVANQTLGQGVPNSVGIRLTGTLDSPMFNLFAIPGNFNQTTILSYLLFGHGTSGGNASKSQQLLLAASSAGLGQTGISNFVENRLGLSDFGIQSNQLLQQDNTSFVLGRQITPKLRARYSIGLIQPVNVLELIYQLSRHWQVQLDNSHLDNGADLIYNIETS
ncbi:MAG: translocation/assembly module TamB domain-containing protein [Pseudomonadota bacterium]